MPFQKGQSGNPGGRPSEPRAALAALLDERFSPVKRKKVIDLLVQDATSEDWEKRKEARPLLLAYTFGKPTEYKEIAGPNGGPIDINSTALSDAAKELELWRKQQSDALSSMPSAAPMPPTSLTPSE